MNARLLRRALLLWLAMSVIAMANGALRVGLLEARLGLLPAHVVSTLTLSSFILLLNLAAGRWLAAPTAAGAWRIGALWALLTVSFEFGFGHFVAGKPWSVLVADYDLLHGRIWILVLVVTASAARCGQLWHRRSV